MTHTGLDISTGFRTQEIELPASVMIGQSNFYDFGLTTLR